MYKCLDCGEEFDEPAKYIERHGFDHPPYEVWHVCPNCGGDFEEIDEDEESGEEETES